MKAAWLISIVLVQLGASVRSGVNPMHQVLQTQQVGQYNRQSTGARDEPGALIYIQESSNNLVTVMVDDRSSSTDGRHEQCPHVKGQGNNKLVLRIVINGYACPLSSNANYGSQPGGARNLVPDVSITYSSNVEVFVSAGGNVAHQGSSRGYPLDMCQNGLTDSLDDYELESDRSCPSIDIAMSTDVNIRIVVDNSRRYPPFRGINLSQMRGYRANLVINSGRACRVPRVNLVHCERAKVQIHTKLSSQD